jgi:dipeptidyl aminopeptidase/acylaminoacyl peptidase
VVASAAVAVPPGAGDAPIAVWGHGAVGTAPGCGPSRRGFDVPYAAELLAAGVIVVAPDFTGLGMEGVAYPYLHGTSAGRSVLDAARAARNVEPAASNRVALYGTSAGGHAVLWANQLAAGDDGAGLDVRAVVALAPLASLPTTMAHYSVTPGLAPYAVQLAATWPSIVPGLDPGAALTPAALARQHLLGSSCLAQLMDHFGGPPSRWLLRDGFLEPSWATQLAEQSPGSSVGAAEVLLFQGERDTAVLSAWTTQLASDLNAGGTPTTLVTNRDADHSGIVPASRVQAVDTMLARLRTEA